jgi:hypothetical protein
MDGCNTHTESYYKRIDGELEETPTTMPKAVMAILSQLFFSRRGLLRANRPDRWSYVVLHTLLKSTKFVFVKKLLSSWIESHIR